MPVSSKKNPSPLLDKARRKALMETVQALDVAVRKAGTQYLLDGRVERVDVQPHAILADVRGSMLYHVAWSGEPTGKWQSRCSCSLGGNCKHAYAAAQFILQNFKFIDSEKKSAQTESEETLDTKIDHLLNLVSNGGRPKNASAKMSKSTVHRILEARSAWDALQLIPTLLTQMGLNIEVSNQHWLPLLECDRKEKRAWLLARELLKHGDRLPSELEPYRNSKSFERDEAKKKEELLVDSLQDWILNLSVRPRTFQRSIRVVWSWDQPSSSGCGPQIQFLLTSKKLKDAPRTFQQIRNFAAEAVRSPHFIGPEDADFLQWLESQHDLLHQGENPSLFNRGRVLHAWLTVWGQSARCVWEDGAPVRYENAPARILPQISIAENSREPPTLGFEVETPDGKRFPLQQTRVVLPREEDPSKEPTFVFVNGAFHWIASPPPKSILAPFLEGGGLALSPSRRNSLLSPLLARFPDLAGRIGDLVCHHPTRISFTFFLHPNDWLCVRLFASSQKTDLRWEFTPEGWVRSREETANESSPLESIDLEKNPADLASEAPVSAKANDSSAAASWSRKDCEHLPDFTVTSPAQEWLESLDVKCAEDASLDEERGWWILINAGRIDSFLHEWTGRPANAEYWGNPPFRSLVAATRRPGAHFKIQSSGLDWFAVSSDWDVPSHFTAADLEKLKDSKDAFIKLSNGRWMNREEAGQLQNTLATMADLGLDPTSKEPQKLTLWQLARTDRQALDRCLDMLESEGDSKTRTALQELRNRLENFHGLSEVPLPKRVQADMRPYQFEGLKFLAYVSSLKLGAVLADDMGLGKTLQALAWMEYLRDLEGPAPCLVVCPASVVYNWQREAEKFVAGTRVLLLTSGEARHELRKEIPKHDLVVTNYALLRRDLEELKQFEFRAVVLDEAQNIKNPDSMVARAAKQLRAVHRLALTGTPLENRLLDFWSIIDFVTPGYLGNRTYFSETFDVHDQPHRRRLLSARLRPILLRRIKRDVAPDLPDRIEERQDCELTEGQRLLYLSELQRAKTLVTELGGEQAALQKKIHILAALTRLRQICCCPVLVGGKPEIGSGKTAALFDILEPLIAEGHKVLVFSQFVRMLNLLETELTARSIPYHILTGQTLKREAVVESFQKDSRASVFLLSLRAAGTGLNLTAASYVVLYDPWWNPAVEAQAIDRTHRIGQDRTVITYRLVAKGTVEDKIYELQQRKAAVVKDVLGEEGFARSLTREDLQFLLSD